MAIFETELLSQNGFHLTILYGYGKTMLIKLNKNLKMICF